MKYKLPEGSNRKLKVNRQAGSCKGMRNVQMPKFESIQ